MVGKIKLITASYTSDSIGQQVATETEKEVFCKVQSISQSEFSSAGQIGIKPRLQANVWTAEYNGAEMVEYNSVRYHVYRRYDDTYGRTELYLTEDEIHERTVTTG